MIENLVYKVINIDALKNKCNNRSKLYVKLNQTLVFTLILQNQKKTATPEIKNYGIVSFLLVPILNNK